MTQTKEASLPRRQTKSQDVQSKSSQENSKWANKSVADPVYVYTKHREIVNNFSTPDVLDINEYEDVLLKSDDEDRNLIHLTISKLKNKRAPPKALNLVDRLVIDDPKLFTQEDETGRIPLLAAAQFNVEILFRVINLVIPDSVLKSIKLKCDGRHQSCPLKAVHERRLEQCPLRAELGRSASPDDTKQRERERSEAPKATQAETGGANAEGVCLHGLIDVDQVVEKNAQLRKILEGALDRKRNNEQPCLQSLMVDRNFDPGQYGDGPIIPLDRFRLLLQLCPATVFESPAQDGYSPLQMAIRLYDCDAIDYNHLFLVINELVDHSHSSIYFKAGHEAKEDMGKTAYRLLKELKNDKSKSDANSQSRKLTEELLKKTCIGAPQEEQKWDAKMKFLYWDDAKAIRKIGLNLFGESAPLDENYVSKARKHSGMRFETVLDFVKLPYWNPQNRQPQHQDVASGQRERVGSDGEKVSDPYTGVFQWLWDSKVRKIFTVEVDDIGPDPHTNAAIRQSLRRPISGTDSFQDFEVEVWKWKKFDICSETILDAAPNAKEVHLYSSGNTAVLRGWACSSGLHQLKNLQQLRIEIYPRNGNDKEDCEGYVPQLKKKLAEQCQRLDIVVDYPGSRSGQGGGSGEKGQGNGRKGDEKLSNITPKSAEWIEKMFDFKQFVSSMLDEKKRPSVRVALLDDGAKLDGLDGRQKGESFRLDNAEYFVGPCSHGTEMARCIREICPMAELYIARLDDSRVGENQKFTTDSCYKALKWAMDMNVDIISMSWTFKKKGIGKDGGENQFLTHIQTAVTNNNVILFASLPDKGATAEISDYAPVGLDGVIKIGSANIYGQQAKENLFAKTDFRLPGEELKTPAGETVSGSSFPTAYASGLAALVLYCLRAHAVLEDSLRRDEDSLALGYSDEDMTKRLDKAKTIDGMKTIFKILSQKNANDDIPEGGFFVRPYLSFGSDFGPSKDKMVNYLRKLVPKILPVK